MMKSAIREFLMDEEGASAIEYALVAAMLAVLLVTIIPDVRTAVNGVFQTIIGALNGSAK